MAKCAKSHQGSSPVSESADSGFQHRCLWVGLLTQFLGHLASVLRWQHMLYPNPLLLKTLLGFAPPKQ